LLFYLAIARRILNDDSTTAVLVLLAFPMAFWNIGLGQNAFLTAGLFGMATLLIDRRPIVAGLLFGLLCYKPHFGLLIPVALAAAMLVFIVWWRKLSLPLRAAALAAATLIAVPVAIFYDLMLGTIAVCWLVRDKERPITATEKTFFAAITLMLLDARHLGESW